MEKHIFLKFKHHFQTSNSKNKSDKANTLTKHIKSDAANREADAIEAKMKWTKTEELYKAKRARTTSLSRTRMI